MMINPGPQTDAMPMMRCPPCSTLSVPPTRLVSEHFVALSTNPMMTASSSSIQVTANAQPRARRRRDAANRAEPRARTTYKLIYMMLNIRICFNIRASAPPSAPLRGPCSRPGDKLADSDSRVRARPRTAGPSYQWLQSRCRRARIVQLIRFSVSAWRFLLRPLDSLGPRLALVCADATLAPSPNLLLATVTEPPMACDENARHTTPPLWTPVGGMMACADGVARQPQFQTPRPRAPGRAGSAGR